MLVGVIWFSSTKATTSRKKNRRIFKASRFSFGRRRIAAWTAWNCWSFGTSENRKNDENYMWLAEEASIIRVPTGHWNCRFIHFPVTLAHNRQRKAIITVTSHKDSVLLLPVKMHIHTQRCWCFTCHLSWRMLMNLSWTGSGYNPNEGLSPHKIWLWDDTLEQTAALLSFPFSFRHEENRCSQLTQLREQRFCQQILIHTESQWDCAPKQLLQESRYGSSCHASPYHEGFSNLHHYKD